MCALVLISLDDRENITTKNGERSKITSKDICASLLAYYGSAVKEGKYLNHVLIQIMSKLIVDSPKNIAVPSVYATLGAAQMAEIIDKIPENIVVSHVDAAPSSTKTSEIV